VSERFYFPELADDSSIEIDGSEAHHLLNVMRVKAGTEIELFDGKGHSATGLIERIGKKSLVVAITNLVAHSRELGTSLVMGVALPKGDRGRFLVEKLTELGVSRLVPLVTGRSNVKTGAGTYEKLNRYVIEASKQCGRNHLMQIQQETRIEDFFVQQPLFERCIVLHPDCQQHLCIDDLRVETSLAVCIGPEGGWTSAELDMIIEAGWHPRAIGQRILRTETAALAMAAVYSSLTS
jgi:16S rRNA (uracil1498-N3)-methyltransferase